MGLLYVQVSDELRKVRTSRGRGGSCRRPGAWAPDKRGRWHKVGRPLFYETAYTSRLRRRNRPRAFQL